jgi:hypothetical protein
MPTVPELQPEELEVLQAEDIGPDPLVRVAVASIDGPVRTQALPRKAGATFNKTVGVTPIRLLTQDHHRASVTLMSIGQAMYIGFSSAMTQDLSRMAQWPAGVPYVMNNDSELWVVSATATTNVSVITEMWATG